MTTRRQADAAARTQHLLEVLASPVRREILWMVWERELPAGDIAEAFDLGAATISGHLKVLRESGLVVMRAEGTFRRYRADQDAVGSLRAVLDDDAHKSFPKNTGGASAPTRRASVAVVEVDAPCDRATAFRAFTDQLLYSRWSRLPVTLVDGRFTAQWDSGRKIRGTYETVVEPSLIVMSWDFANDEVPLPGAGMRAYLHLGERDRGRRCRLELHQMVATDDQAQFMARVWGLLLARFRDGVIDAVAAEAAVQKAQTRRRR